MVMWRCWGYSWTVFLERSKDASGNDNADFIYFQICSANPTYKGQGITQANWIGPARTAMEMHNDAGATSSLGGYIGVYPIQPVFGWARNPLLCGLRGCTYDWQELDQASIAIYPGVAHNYIVVNRAGTGGSGSWNNNTIHAMLFRYD
jgi:hypothetical protein